MSACHVISIMKREIHHKLSKAQNEKGERNESAETAVEYHQRNRMGSHRMLPADQAALTDPFKGKSGLSKMKYIFIGILIFAIPLVWFAVHSISIERQAKETLCRELADVLKAPIESKFHSGAVGEGNDSWMEYHFQFNVSASRPTMLSHKKFTAEMLPNQSYLLYGKASFSETPGRSEWRINDVTFEKLEQIQTTLRAPK